MVGLIGENVNKYVNNNSDKSIQPASVDVRLDNVFKIPTTEVLDMNGKNRWRTVYMNKFLLLPPSFSMDGDKIKKEKVNSGFRRRMEGLYGIKHIINGLILGTTVESVNVPNNCECMIDGVSSLGRLGLQIHQTAGYIDAGFNGKITLEIIATHPVIVYAFNRIGQIRINKLECDVKRIYSGKYQSQDTVVESRIEVDNSIDEKLYNEYIKLRKSGILNERDLCLKLGINYGVLESLQNVIKPMDLL